MDVERISNIDPEVKQKLRIRAASHCVLIEEEARGILSAAVNQSEEIAPPKTQGEMKDRLDMVRGFGKTVRRDEARMRSC